jgi:uncharacterized protein (DUF1684 family)
MTACAPMDESVQAGGAPAEATSISPVAEWEKWRAEENAAWATDEFAILKIDDAVYLNDGQTAWLTGGPQAYKWTLDALSAPSAWSITYTGGKADVHDGRKTETFTLEKVQHVPLRPGTDVRFALTQVKPDVNGLRVMVYNQANPLAHNFKGLEHFAYNPAFVVDATFSANSKVVEVDFQTSRGWYKRFYRVGRAFFTLEGKPVGLSMYTDTEVPADVKQLSAFFLDDLSGKETYGTGRYIDIEVNGLPKRLTLDFNRAYNPNCARSPHYNCPLATDKIELPIRAGEKIPPKH